ncbi:MAG: hypothetical protein H6843_06795 [Rhodospirillaceae bacterium]|nr:hypothetical protein [Rhodospirillaceae bacterium]
MAIVVAPDPPMGSALRLGTLRDRLHGLLQRRAAPTARPSAIDADTPLTDAQAALTTWQDNRAAFDKIDGELQGLPKRALPICHWLDRRRRRLVLGIVVGCGLGAAVLALRSADSPIWAPVAALGLLTHIVRAAYLGGRHLRQAAFRERVRERLATAAKGVAGVGQACLVALFPLGFGAQWVAVLALVSVSVVAGLVAYLSHAADPRWDVIEQDHAQAKGKLLAAERRAHQAIANARTACEHQLATLSGQQAPRAIAGR